MEIEFYVNCPWLKKQATIIYTKFYSIRTNQLLTVKMDMDQFPVRFENRMNLTFIKPGPKSELANWMQQTFSSKKIITRVY